MKKSIIALILAFTFALGLASCASSGDHDTNTTEPSTEPKNYPAVATFFEDTTADYEMPMMMDLDDDLLQDMYGIDPALLDEYVAKIPGMNVHATEFFVAKVKDGNMDAVKNGIESRLNALDQTWSQYLPDQYELVQNAKTVEEGNYILFVVSENADAVASAFSTTYGK